MSESTYERARTIAMALLGGRYTDNGEVVGTDEISWAISEAQKAFPLGEEGASRLSRDIEASFNVSIGLAGVLDGDSDHVDWLDSRRSTINWGLSRRYHRWLGTEKNLPPAVLGRLDEVTDAVLGRLGDPEKKSPWDRRGMVVGYVQSGKTSNYTSLICKAADAGYKVIIVLAGMDNALRSQTQIRIDEGVVGFNTQAGQLADQQHARIGVGAMQADAGMQVQSLTSSYEKGDFSASHAKKLGVVAGGKDPLILVVKKNVSILKNVTKWLTTYTPSTRQDGKRTVVQGIPLLVIDDECDNASVNTKVDDPDVEPTAINRMIRGLLASFDQSAYVGYTATPFANVFITPESAQGDTHGEDLFPRDFIVALKRPSDYVGPSRVFGVDGDPERGIEAGEPLPIIRNLIDHEEWLPTGHKKDFEVGSALPDSLEEAILSFILVCAARRARGQVTDHNSMLVHVTRFVDVQEGVREAVEAYLLGVKHRIAYGDGSRSPSIIETLREMWEDDFRATTESMGAEAYEHMPWSEVEAQLEPASKKIVVKSINGKSNEVLDYLKHEKDGLSVIAVGGAKLSRGLTLEGLSVSYYLRSSKMYDTLMQMGRWFGFRNGYLDLCRLYTTRGLCEWYREIALATEDLLEQLDEMAAAGATPKEFGLKVMLSPSGLTITRAGAMRWGTRMKVSYSGSLAETVTFEATPERIASNLQAFEELVGRCDAVASPRPRLKDGGGPVWEGIPADLVKDFLGSYSTHPNSPRANSTLLQRYVEKRNQAVSPELTSWTVALMSLSANHVNVAGHEVGTMKRKRLKDFESPGEMRIKRLLSPSDELIDLDEEKVKEARRLTDVDWERGVLNQPDLKRPGNIDPKHIRRLRGAQKGLLLLYLISPEDDEPLQELPMPAIGVSFPESADALASAIEYLVNAVYWDWNLDED